MRKSIKMIQWLFIFVLICFMHMPQEVLAQEATSVVGIEAVVGRDEFYYEAEDVWISDIVEEVKLTLGDGSTLTCKMWDGTWNQYGLVGNILDEDGIRAKKDENGKYPVGEYKCIVSCGDITCEIPVTVVSLNDIAIDIAVGGTVSGLEGTEDYYNSEYSGGYWLKMELTEIGSYKLEKSAQGLCETIYGTTGNWESNYGDGESIYITQATTVYCYVKGSDTFDVSLTKLLDIIDIDGEVFLDTFYYELSEIHNSWVVNEVNIYDRMKFTLEDGTILDYGRWDENYQDCLGKIKNDYGIKYGLYDLEGNSVSWAYCPVGDYVCKYYVDRSEVCWDIPIKVVSIEDEAVEIALGETVEGLAGTEYYEGYPVDHRGGHWFKIDIEEPGNYLLDKSSEGRFSFYGVTQGIDLTGTTWGQYVRAVNITEADTYYLFVKGKDTFDVTLYKVAESISLDKSTVSLTAGECTTLSAIAEPSDAYEEILWTSDNEAVATVDSTGKVTAVSAGTATITATAVGSEVSDTCIVTVTAPVVDKVDSFVTRMYQQCLSRDPDEAGLEGWAGQLEGGYMNGAQIAEQFVFSDEMLAKNLSNEEFVNILYQSMMGREADEAGRAGWVSQLSGGYMTRSEVTKSFVESVEFTAICADYEIVRGDYDASIAPIEHFVTRFYTLCLERTPDQAGLYGWVGQLKGRNMNGAQIANAFIFSDEFVNKNVSNEKYIELLYNTLMGRPSDEGGKTGWMGQLQGGYMTRKDMMKAFIESNEFTEICNAYDITRGTVE